MTLFFGVLSISLLCLMANMWSEVLDHRRSTAARAEGFDAAWAAIKKREQRCDQRDRSVLERAAELDRREADLRDMDAYFAAEFQRVAVPYFEAIGQGAQAAFLARIPKTTWRLRDATPPATPSAPARPTASLEASAKIIPLDPRKDCPRDPPPHVPAPPPLGRDSTPFEASGRSSRHS